MVVDFACSAVGAHLIHPRQTNSQPTPVYTRAGRQPGRQPRRSHRRRRGSGGSGLRRLQIRRRSGGRIVLPPGCFVWVRHFAKSSISAKNRVQCAGDRHLRRLVPGDPHDRLIGGVEAVSTPIGRLAANVTEPVLYRAIGPPKADFPSAHQRLSVYPPSSIKQAYIALVAG